MTTRRKFLSTAGIGRWPRCTLAAPAVKAQSPIKWRMQTYAGPALAEHVIKPAIDSFNKVAGKGRDGDRAVLRRPAGADRRAVPRHAEGHHRRRAVGRRLHGFADRSHGLRRLLPLCLALFARRAGAVQPVRPEAKSGTRNTPSRRREAHLCRRLGSLPLRHQGPDPQPGRHEGQARLHLPDGRPFPDAVRRGPGDPALGRHRGRGADRRAGRHRLVGHHRGLHGRLGRRDQLLPDQQHLRRLGRLLLRQHGPLERAARSPEGAAAAGHGPARTTIASGGTGAARPACASTAPSCKLTHHSGRGMGRRSKRRPCKFWDEIAAESPTKAKVVEIFREVQCRHAKGRPALVSRI